MKDYRRALLDADTFQREQIRRRLRHDPGCSGAALFNFCKVALGMRDMEWQVHGRLCTYLEEFYYGRTSKRWVTGHVAHLMDLLPRGSLKTSIVTIGFPLWVLYLNDPPAVLRETGQRWQPPASFNGKKGYDQRFLICGETGDKVREFMGPIRTHLEQNRFLRQLYGPLIPDEKRSRQLTADRISVMYRMNLTAKEANINATSLAGAKVGTHVDIAILDDIVTSEQVRSEEMIKRGIEFYKGLQPILDPPMSLMLINGTRWHDSDLYGHLIDRHEKGQMNALVYIERSERTPKQIESGQRPYFWPSRFGPEVLEGMKATMDPWFYSAQMNNDVIDEGTAPFKKSYFVGTEFELDPDRDRLWLDACTKITTVDPAISKGKDACYAVVVTCAWDADGHCWVLDCFRQKDVHPDALLREVFRHNRVWRPRIVGIETKGFQVIYQHNAMTMSRQLGEYPPFEPLKEGGRSKEIRIMGLEPICRGKRFHWQRKHHFIIDEFSRYPRGKYRDTLDALAYQNDIAYPGKKIPEAEPVAGTPEAMQKNIMKLHQKRLAAMGIDVYKKKVKSWLEA